jgi:hypothetical protein
VKLGFDARTATRNMPQIRGRLPLILLVTLTAMVVIFDPQKAHAGESVTIKLKVSNCEGCTIHAGNLATGWGMGVDSPLTVQTVAAGRALFILPKSVTRGLSFSINNPGPNIEYFSDKLAVARYTGMPKGKRVKPHRAAEAAYATPCWAGARKNRVNLRMTVDYFPVWSHADGRYLDALRAYFNPSLRSIGSGWETWYGQLGTQSVIDCNGNFEPVWYVP